MSTLRLREQHPHLSQSIAAIAWRVSFAADEGPRPLHPARGM
jgi:hypothetical protein